MSILKFSIISKNIIDGIVDKCKSLLPGSSHPEDAKIVITEGNENLYPI